MIYCGTQLSVSDNSGAKRVECIKLYNKINVGVIGDQILVSVKEIVGKQKSKVQKGEMYRALIVETVSGMNRRDGSGIKFGRNAVVLLNAQGTPIGTRISGLVTYELRRLQLSKILSLATTVI